ncbi:ran-binding protein 1 homolog c-like [Asparagus officinalis]|uniref:ran-binding protein 1 homolog c-like n=1 Tax=Asparagus officinalis TaxID=4686 RepID=UPI00098DE8D3|nr:ran-binding protein 1 homolog c-like [Asparagus officinalis]
MGPRPREGFIPNPSLISHFPSLSSFPPLPLLVLFAGAGPAPPPYRRAAVAVADRRDEEESHDAAIEDEDTGAQIAPIIKLEEVAVTTGKEDEEAILDLKAKLYRFDKEGKQWKERGSGSGSVKLLKHKESGKVRLVMRQAKTLKICANHYGEIFS